MYKRLAVLNLAAWLVSAVEVMPRLTESRFDLSLGAIAVIGLAGAVAWLRHWRGWRLVAAGAAAIYLAYYAMRMYVVEIEPLLAILPLPQAVADAFYVVWSSPMGRLSHGEVLDAAGQLWRGCVMPLLQVGVLAAASRRSS